MRRFEEALAAGRKAIKSRRTLFFLLLSAFMGIDAAIYELLEHRYATAVVAVVFFLIIAPWLGWNYIKPQE